jgi:hypothetical protein
MPNTDAITQTRTFWGICQAVPSGRWAQHGYLYDSEEEGQRKLRWFRQWYPEAFLVEMAMTTLENNFHAPQLPRRSKYRSEPEPPDNQKEQEQPSKAFGLRLVK